MAQATFSAPSVSCMSCQATIEDALSELEGHEATAVDLATRQIQITYDEDLLDAERIGEQITGAGYPATLVTA